MFRFVALGASVIFLILFVLLAFLPATYVVTYGVEGDAGAIFMGRRASSMFLGLALLMWQVRDAPASSLRSTICWAMAVLFAGIAVTGIIEYLNGTAGAVILIAALGELIVAALFVGARDSSCVCVHQVKKLLKILSQGACHCYQSRAKPRTTDRWPSGRRRTPGKCVGGRPSPGFESLSVRHLHLPKQMMGPLGALFSFCFKGV